MKHYRLPFMVCLLSLITPALAVPAQPTGAQLSPTAAPSKPWYESLVVKGYIQLDSTFPEGNAVVGANSNFRIRRARPTIIAQVDPLTRVQFQFDLSTGRLGSGASSVMVTDTFAERKVPNFAFVQFGQQLLPFGHEVYEDNAALRSPLELSYTAEQIALAERDIGLMVRSLSPIDSHFYWAVAAVNGQGFRTADANANKTIVGSIVGGPNPNLRVGASCITGTWQCGGKDYRRDVLGLEFRSDFSKAVNLEGELYNVFFVDSITAPTKQARYSGGYLLFESWIGAWKSIPFIRYQRTYGDLDYRSFDLGWRYQYTATQRVTAEYDMVKGHQRNQFGLRWQLAF